MITSELLNEIMFIFTCRSDDRWKHVCKKGTANEYINIYIYALKGHAKAIPLKFHDTNINITLKIMIFLL